MKVSYTWLQRYFENPLPGPLEIETAIGLKAFEPEGMEDVGNDTVIDFDVLPNRAHDCLCHRGIAREIAVILGRDDMVSKPAIYNISDNTYEEQETELTVTIENKQHCYRYMGRIIENIQVKESPPWLRESLEAIGQKSINTIVDATNYVLFELGQTLLAFDAQKIQGGIVVRNARNGETMTTLDKRVVELIDQDLVISDVADATLAIAGVKGGIHAEVTPETTSIILEAANFNPTLTRRTSRRLDILTDASKRYENEISSELAAEAIEAVTRLIIQIAGTEHTRIQKITEEYPKPHALSPINLEHGHIESLLGLSISSSDVISILEGIQCQVIKHEGGYTVTPPPLRLDLVIPQDLIEEIGRIYGYDKLDEMSVNDIPFTPRVNPIVYWQQIIKEKLLQNGFSEVITYSFTDHGDLEMANALASDKNFLRTNLSEGLEQSRELNAKNIDLFQAKDLRLFEVGSVFPHGKEEYHLAICIDPLAHKLRSAGSHEGLEDITRHISSLMGIETDDYLVNRSPLIYELNFSQMIERATTPDSYDDLLTSTPPYSQFYNLHQPYSSHPYMTRDIAVWLPEGVSSSELESLLIQEGTSLLVQSPTLVDQFTKDNRTSYAYRMVFQDMERTLTDGEINLIMDDIYKQCLDNGWEVR